MRFELTTLTLAISPAASSIAADPSLEYEIVYYNQMTKK